MLAKWIIYYGACQARFKYSEKGCMGCNSLFEGDNKEYVLCRDFYIQYAREKINLDSKTYFLNRFNLSIN